MKKTNKYLCTLAAGVLMLSLLNSCSEKKDSKEEVSITTEFNLDIVKAEIEEANTNFYGTSGRWRFHRLSECLHH